MVANGESLLQTAENLVSGQSSSVTKGLKTEKRTKPEAVVMFVTPDMAERWLSANIHNRDLRSERVLTLAGVMSRGDYDMTSDGIGFNTRGELVNGQHRLTAILVSETPVWMVVVRGLTPTAQEVMDQGLPRSLIDTLKFHKVKYYSLMAPSLRWMARLEYAWKTGRPNYANERPQVPFFMQILRDHPGLMDLPVDVTRVRRGILVTPGVLLPLWYHLRLKDPVESEIFMSKLAIGNELTTTDPIFVVRRLIENDRRRNYEHMPDYREMALLIKAWNAWREVKPVVSLTFNFGQTVKERFPVII